MMYKPYNNRSDSITYSHSPTMVRWLLFLLVVVDTVTIQMVSSYTVLSSTTTIPAIVPKIPFPSTVSQPPQHRQQILTLPSTSSNNTNRNNSPSVFNIVPAFASSSSFLIMMLFCISSWMTFPSVSHAALDMEAFATQQLQQPSTSISSGRSKSRDYSDTTTSTTSPTSSTSTDTMSPDEALCRFGQPGPLKGDACVRAHISTAPRTKNGVDAYGKLASRETYTKCTKQYTLVNNEYYTSEWICQ
jgi:hypothetical protein